MLCYGRDIFYRSWDSASLKKKKNKKTKNQKKIKTKKAKNKKQNETGTSLFGKRKFNFGGSIKITPESLTQDVFLFQNKINRTHLNVHNGVIVISKI